MVIPAWMTRRVGILGYIFMEIFAIKGYFPGKWGWLAFGLGMLMGFMVLRPKEIHLAEKKEN